MAEIPKGVLSERFQQHMKGRRLKTGVFLTFSFDAGFFEQEVLPVFIDVPLSQSPALRVAQLEDVIRSQVDHLAVYYDPAALQPGAESAKLDVRRIPVTYGNACFHPKNVLLLVESVEPKDDGTRDQKLIVGTLSANLTRAGWWENVEVCHIEEVGDNDAVGFRDDLLELIGRVKRACGEGYEHEALEKIRRFIVHRTSQRPRSRMKDVLYPRLYSGGATVPDFLSDVLGAQLAGLNLEVISPYFDDSNPQPLRELIERFDPREVRVFLPRKDDGSALCSDAYYAAVRKLPNTSWGQLPSALLRMGKSENSAMRRVHAKVYRFFDPNHRYEALFVGSVNLTGAAHSKGGNFETAFLVETDPARVPDWWLATDTKTPAAFQGGSDDVEASASPASALAVRYQWDDGRALALWNASTPSPELHIECNGVPLFVLTDLPPRGWAPLSDEEARAIAERLPSTSYLTVQMAGEEPATILVQEEGMSHKPSLFMSLSAADILRYWALLTPEQRAAFIEERFAELNALFGGDAVNPYRPPPPDSSSMFATFAGVFHSFGSLEKAVLVAIEHDREKEATFRLFGKKYDSLPHLLDRVLEEEKESDPLVRYVILLCARQLLDEVGRRAPEFRQDHKEDFDRLRKRVDQGNVLRRQLVFADPADQDSFLDWFERWFLARAEPLEVER